MDPGIRAEVRIDHPADCQIARVIGRSGGTGHSVRRSVDPTAPEEMTEEFVVDDDAEVDEEELRDREELGQIFSYGSERVYRFRRPLDRGCACECIEQFDCPVTDVYAREGSLFLTFHVRELDRLREVIATLREQYANVDVRRLLHGRSEDAAENLVLVDQNELTERQREVLETAHEMGYFNHPKDSNASEVAATLDITTATFTEHMAVAQRKLLDAIVAE